MSRKATTPSDRTDRAFSIYVSQGAKRTYRAVADQLGVSVRTVRHWAKEGDWKQRLHEHEAGVARRLADQAIDSQANLLARDQKIVHMALMKLAKGIAEDRVKLQAGDLDRLIRLRTYLDEYQANRFTRSIDDVVAYLRGLGPDQQQELVDKLRKGP